MRNRLASLALLASVLSGWVAPARADTIVFSSFPATTTPIALPDEEYVTTFGFVPTVSGTVNTLTVPIELPEIRTLLTFSLWNSDGMVPQTSLAEFWSFWPDSTSVTASLAASTPVFLNAGSLYFLGVNVRDIAVLFEGSAGQTGPMFWAETWAGYLGPWQPLQDAPWARGSVRTPAFSLSAQEAAPVPEPATMLLIGAGIAGMAARRRYRKVSGI